AEMWLSNATRPIVPSTAVSASPTGIRAATTAPNVSSMLTSVIGREGRGARAYEVFAARVGDFLFRTRFAELLDRETWVRPLRGRRRLERGSDTVFRHAFRAGDLGASQRGVAVER